MRITGFGLDLTAYAGEDQSGDSAAIDLDILCEHPQYLMIGVLDELDMQCNEDNRNRTRSDSGDAGEDKSLACALSLRIRG